MSSSGRPILPWGMSEIHCFRRSGLSSRIFWVLRVTDQQVSEGPDITAASVA